MVKRADVACRLAQLDAHRAARVLDMAFDRARRAGDRNDGARRDRGRQFGADRDQDRIAVGGGELVGLGEDDVKRLRCGEETLDGGSLGRAQILIDHEQDAVGRRGAGRKFSEPPLVALDGAGVDQADDVARLRGIGAGGFDQDVDECGLAAERRTRDQKCAACRL